ncbi:hypothetical protein [Streptomyces sp. NPDC052107]|uniref:hypothetical protein n=1 Tax=Streptomyces sp. NPDC052107 TaxID=3155632 RepID=UPI003423465F
MRAIGELPDVEAGHPDIDVRFDGVTVRLITLTDDFYGLSERDVELARHAQGCRPHHARRAPFAGSRLQRPAVRPRT